MMESINKARAMECDTAEDFLEILNNHDWYCLLYTSPSPRDRTRSRMPSSA